MTLQGSKIHFKAMHQNIRKKATIVVLYTTRMGQTQGQLVQTNSLRCSIAGGRKHYFEMLYEIFLRFPMIETRAV